MSKVSYSMSTKKDNCLAWKLLAVIAILVALALMIALIVVALKNKELNEIVKNTSRQKQTPICPSGNEDIDLREPPVPPVFADLTQNEFEVLSYYLHTRPELNLVRVTEAEVNSSYLYLVEMLLPNKFDVLRHLNDSGVKPARWAKAVIFRGDLSPPQVEEYRVGPLPNPTSHTLIDYAQRKKNPIPFSYRPYTFTEFVALRGSLIRDIERIAGKVLLESYGASFTNCGKTCLGFVPVPVSTSAYGKITRNMWLWLNHVAEFFTLHPLDFQVLVNLDGTDPAKYTITKVWYNQQTFDSLEELAAAYDNGTVGKLQIQFPTAGENLFSTLNRRGDAFPKDNLRRPLQFEPDGKRYSISGQHVGYLGWTFDYRMSSSNGPMLFDVRYNGDRIAYEISLQEIAVLYSASNPAVRFANYIDSALLIGTLSKTLIPGADCPEHATFLPARHFTEASDNSVVYENALCMFEQDTGVPLRRHHSANHRDAGDFYGGMMDDVLVFRAILTAGNYDYIFDFVFHQNGAIEVRAISTGYIMTSYKSSSEGGYGFHIHNDIIGNIHHHLFSFKVDLDIQGTSNRFETLDIGVEDVDNSAWIDNPTGSSSSQINFKRNLKRAELEAAYKFSFEKPKYLLFHNDQAKTEHGAPRAYRVAIDGISKQTLPENGSESSLSWSRYQMAVTKHHDSEMKSSSIYAMWDAVDPVRNFQNYLDDNESIVDQMAYLVLVVLAVVAFHPDTMSAVLSKKCRSTFSISVNQLFRTRQELRSLARRVGGEFRPRSGYRPSRRRRPRRSSFVGCDTMLVINESFDTGTVVDAIDTKAEYTLWMPPPCEGDGGLQASQPVYDVNCQGTCCSGSPGNQQGSCVKKSFPIMYIIIKNGGPELKLVNQFIMCECQNHG